MRCQGLRSRHRRPAAQAKGKGESPRVGDGLPGGWAEQPATPRGGIMEPGSRGWSGSGRQVGIEEAQGARHGGGEAEYARVAMAVEKVVVLLK